VPEVEGKDVDGLKREADKSEDAGRKKFKAAEEASEKLPVSKLPVRTLSQVNRAQVPGV